MSIVAAAPEHAAAWAALRHALWPQDPLQTHADEIRCYFDAPDGRDPSLQAALIHLDVAGEPNGFIELSVRPFVDGCSGPAAYVEGWFVAPAARRRGIGGLLIRAAERWAVERGLHEIASDTTLDNAVSQNAHLALGFSEMDRIVQYRKEV